ncbi:MAG: PLP-dependent transferase [Candidatus Marinimicrobia bacterium]|nr:PLP-dependent transferase [Candidatus Neomarinimicrobiota bacterium]
MPRKIDHRFDTRAMHVGQEPDPATGAVVPPIYLTSTFAQEDFGVHKGYDYSRAANPTRQNLEATIASLESASRGVAFASGMAAFSAIVTRFKSGDHLVLSENVYGGTYRALTQVFDRFGIGCSWIDTTRLDNVRGAITSSTVAILIETPSNPMMSITDLAGVAQIARERNLLSIVDNTFMSPYFQRPLEHGIDVVYHSITKYLAGHSDIIGGIVVTSNEELADDLAFTQKSLGAVPSPFDCWLTSRSLKTLGVRMERHNANALRLAGFLVDRQEVKQVFYPGLESHPQHALATRQQTSPDGRPAYGGIISIETGSLDNARRFARGVKVFTLAESLGGVESLVNHPATMTHGSVPRQKRESFGLTDGLVRLSVGIEDVRDLEADLDQALSGLK